MIPSPYDFSFVAIDFAFIAKTVPVVLKLNLMMEYGQFLISLYI